MGSDACVPPPGLIVYRIDVSDVAIALLTYVPTGGSRIPTLTATEGDVLRAILVGKGNSEIAAERGTALRTVANQVARIFQKMGVGSRAELAARWLEG